MNTIAIDTIILSGSFLSVNTNFSWLSETVMNLTSWLAAYALFYFLRKPMIKYLKRTFTKSFLEKIFSKKTVEDCCDDETNK